jgi:hypothetical protein
MAVNDSGVAMIKTAFLAIALIALQGVRSVAEDLNMYVCATRPDVALRDYRTLKPVRKLKNDECLVVAEKYKHPKPEYMAVFDSSKKLRAVHKKYVAFGIEGEPTEDEVIAIRIQDALPKNYSKALAKDACFYLRIGVSPSETAQTVEKKLREYNRFGSLNLTAFDLVDLPEKIVRSQMHCVGR